MSAFPDRQIQVFLAFWATAAVSCGSFLQKTPAPGEQLKKVTSISRGNLFFPDHPKPVFVQGLPYFMAAILQPLALKIGQEQIAAKDQVLGPRQGLL